MLENLTDKVGNALRKLTGRASLSADNIKDGLKEIRNSLLDADVALDAATSFIDKVKGNILGTDVPKGLTPAQFLVKLVNAELIDLMGGANQALNLETQPPAVIMVAGLQGSGKTTSVAKLAKWLQETQQKKVLVASTDIYRPAAMEQLATVANQVNATCLATNPNQQPTQITEAALTKARREQFDIVIIDTAGRLHIDTELMQEIQQIHKIASPIETLFVIDSMMGQDAVVAAKTFHSYIPLTGAILTKIDGDARGGAALSVKYVTGAPIKFMGTGEKLDKLELFHPERIASRILGMGDVLTLVEELEQKIDKQKAEKLAKKIQAGRGFDLADFADQLRQMKSMGGMENMLGKLPGMGKLKEIAKDKLDDGKTTAMLAAIDSMTKKERTRPDLVKNKGSRKKRIAAGSGTSIQVVNQVIKQHTQMQKMMKKFSGKGGMKNMQNMLSRLPGGMGNMLPPGGI